MRWDLRYPNGENDVPATPGAPGSLYITSETEQACQVCGAPTKWIEISFEAHLCSDECDDVMWTRYSEACEASDVRAAAAGPPVDDELGF